MYRADTSRHDKLDRGRWLMGNRSGVLELAVLGLLHEAPMHGYELRKRVNAQFGWGRVLSFGSLYPCLKAMLRNGLITADPGTPESGRRTKIVQMTSIRVAIVGVGNCASSLVQGVHYYRDAKPEERVPGLMHVQFGDYHVRDVEFVAAFDVDGKKVGLDLADAIGASENNTIKICDVPPTGVTVQRGHTLDGLGKYYREPITESDP